jgi:AcrR family transcriptional regulator
MAEPGQGARPPGGRVPYPVAARSLLRDTVITAVDDLARTRGWAATTMSDVAAAAGVSRQTVYNEFGSRSALVEAYLAREIGELVAATAVAVRANADNAHNALREAFALFLKLASDEPVVQIIVSDGTDGELMQMLTGVGQSLAGAQIATLITEVWPQVTLDDAALLAESLVRLAISHSLLPSDPPAVVAEGVSRMLAPFVDRILGPD